MIDKKQTELLHEIERDLENIASEICSISTDISDFVPFLQSMEIHSEEIAAALRIQTQILACNYYCGIARLKKHKSCPIEEHP